MVDREPALPGARGAPWPMRRNLGDRVEAHRFFQYLFLRQWLELKSYANERGIRVIGDMPIFVAHDSADTWAHPRLWKIDAHGQPVVVAGVPPDAFSTTGQLWGSPLYDWDRLREEGFGWWIDRMREALKMVNVVRLDHFRGFAACWEVPAANETAEHGSWIEVPGHALFRAMADTLGGDLPIIAEDLGIITDDVHELRDAFGFPSMRVLQFAWGGDPHNPHLPHRYTRTSWVRAPTTTNRWWAGSPTAPASAPPRRSGSSARAACAISAPTAPTSTGISFAPSRCRWPTSASCPCRICSAPTRRPA